MGIYKVAYGASGILTLLSFTAVLAFIQSAIQNYLRANRENRLYSGTSVIYSLAYVIFSIGLALLLKPFGLTMQGAAMGRYIAYAAIIIIMLYMMRHMPAIKVKAVRLSRSAKIEMVKYSGNSLVANVFSQIMPLNEALLLGFMVNKHDFGDFSAAQIVPNSIGYIANAVIIFIFPYFAKNYKDGAWIYNKTKKVILTMSALFAVICVVGILFSPQIVLLFGKRFKTPNAVRLMRLFFITYGVNAALRIPVGNILAAVGEIRFNVINAFFASTVHFGICWALTASFGINGAAYGLMIGYVLSGLAGIIYLKYYCNKLKRKNPSTLV